MKGFFGFTAPEPPKKTKSAPVSFDCETCGLYKTVLSPKMDVSGRGRKRILNVGEGPGEVEDKNGRQWQGATGQLLERTYREVGIELFTDCWNINAVNCRPTEPAKTKEVKNREPTPLEINCCRVEKVDPAILSLKPHVIACMGGVGLESVLATRCDEDVGSIMQWRGFAIPDRTLGAWVCPTFHPSYVSRTTAVDSRERNGAVMVVWLNDLRQIRRLTDVPLPEYDDEEDMVQIVSEEEAANLLNSYARGERADEVFFDYETTGLKPHDTANHKIVLMSVSSSDAETYAFVFPEGKRGIVAVQNFLSSPNVKKGGHNIKFEDLWSSVFLKTDVVGWSWCSMQAVHVEDNRSKITNLKFQSYVNFGVSGYGKEIAPYLDAIDKDNANSLNRIMEFIAKPGGQEKALVYCGMDSLFSRRLAAIQRKSTAPAFKTGLYEIVRDGALALADCEATGIRLDKEEAQRSIELFTNRIDRLERLALESDVGQALIKRYGETDKAKKKVEGANIDSPQQLGVVLYEDMKIEPSKVTKTGRGSTDEEALEELAVRITGVDHIMARRKLKKIRDTYLTSFIEESFGGFIYALYNLHLARSGRSSADHPNFQNIPVRNEEAMNACRGVLFPRHGRRLTEIDFASIEVRTSEWYHHDPTMKSYILDPNTDMHADMAKQIFVFNAFDKTNKAMKHLRYSAKNGFVFPQFYGDYWKSCAQYLAKHTKLPQVGKWKAGMGMEIPGGHLADHLIANRITRYEEFESHVKRVEDDFWKRRFREYTRWKDRWWAQYQRDGYIEFLTGFMCVDILSRNECLNRPIQGVAFQCLLWLLVQMNLERIRRKWDTVFVGQIHDSIVADGPTEEVSEVIETAQSLIKRLEKEWKFISVPLEIEAEVAGVDEPWSKKRPWTGE